MGAPTRKNMNYYQRAVVEDGLLRGLNQLAEEGIIIMAKDKPATSSGSYERKNWKNKPYMLRLIKSEEVANKYYHSEEWTDQNGKKRQPDDPKEQTQFKLTFEVAKGEKAGDWISVFAPHWFAVDNNDQPRGKRAVIARAIKPEFNLHNGIEDDHSDLMDGVCMGLVEPKDEPKYGKVVKFYPVDEDEEIPERLETLKAHVEANNGHPKNLPVTEEVDDPEEIPF